MHSASFSYFISPAGDTWIINTMSCFLTITSKLKNYCSARENETAHPMQSSLHKNIYIWLLLQMRLFYIHVFFTNWTDSWENWHFMYSGCCSTSKWEPLIFLLPSQCSHYVSVLSSNIQVSLRRKVYELANLFSTWWNGDLS
jgi:hypothetical protein